MTAIDTPGVAIPRCSGLSAPLSLAGTAPTARRWWLIEDPGPWGSHPVRDASQEWIAACGARAGEHARVVLIRQHDSHHNRRRSTEQRIFTFAPGDESVWCRSIHRGEDPCLDDLNHVPTDSRWSPTTEHPRVIVCTNGRRDRCCAELGRSTLDELPSDIRDRVWESTHLGGHRFAPVALLVPNGSVLGRVTPATLVDIARNDVLDLDTLRGRSDLSAPEQLAEHSARLTWGLRSTHTHLDVTSSAAPDDPRVCEVRVTGPDGQIHQINARSRALGPTIVSCDGSTAPGTVWEETD